MNNNPRIVVICLIVLNLVVLLGQIWPEGAPPFARTANIVIVAADIVFLVTMMRRRS